MFSDVEVRRCDGGDHDSSPRAKYAGPVPVRGARPLSQQSPFTGPQLSVIASFNQRMAVSISQNTFQCVAGFQRG